MGILFNMTKTVASVTVSRGEYYKGVLKDGLFTNAKHAKATSSNINKQMQQGNKLITEKGQK